MARSSSVAADRAVVAWALGHDLAGGLLDAPALNLPGMGMMNTGSSHDISEWLRKEKSADYYRAAAKRARKLLEEATTPRLKQYLGEVIAQCERFAEESQ